MGKKPEVGARSPSPRHTKRVSNARNKHWLALINKEWGNFTVGIIENRNKTSRWQFWKEKRKHKKKT